MTTRTFATQTSLSRSPTSLVSLGRQYTKVHPSLSSTRSSSSTRALPIASHAQDEPRQTLSSAFSSGAVKGESMVRPSHTETPARACAAGAAMKCSPDTLTVQEGTVSNPFLIPETPAATPISQKIPNCSTSSAAQVADGLFKDEVSSSASIASAASVGRSPSAGVAQNGRDTDSRAAVSSDSSPLPSDDESNHSDSNDSSALENEMKAEVEGVPVKEGMSISAGDTDEQKSRLSHTPSKEVAHAAALGTVNNPVVIPPTPPVLTPKATQSRNSRVQLPPPPPVPTPIAKLHKSSAPCEVLQGNSEAMDQTGSVLPPPPPVPTPLAKRHKSAAPLEQPASNSMVDSPVRVCPETTAKTPPTPPVPTPLAKVHKSAAPLDSPLHNLRSTSENDQNEDRNYRLGFAQDSPACVNSKLHAKTPPTPPIPTPLAKIHKSAAPFPRESVSVDTSRSESNAETFVSHVSSPPTPPVPTPLAKVHKSCAPSEGYQAPSSISEDDPFSNAREEHTGEQGDVATDERSELKESIDEGAQTSLVSSPERESTLQDSKVSGLRAYDDDLVSAEIHSRVDLDEKVPPETPTTESTPVASSAPDDRRRRLVSLSLSAAPERKPVERGVCLKHRCSQSLCFPETPETTS